MTTVVIPFAGVEGKTRLDAPGRARGELSLAMLGDVLEAALAVGAVRVVTADEDGADAARAAGAGVVPEPGRGQGAAVLAGLAGLDERETLVVNADVACATSADLRALLAHAQAGRVGLVEALDGTTNALALPSPEAFADLYGPRSAARFRLHASALGLDVVVAAVPNLVDDVDTIDDLRRVRARLGPRSRAALERLRVEALR